MSFLNVVFFELLYNWNIFIHDSLKYILKLRWIFQCTLGRFGSSFIRNLDQFLLKFQNILNNLVKFIYVNFEVFRKLFEFPIYRLYEVGK